MILVNICLLQLTVYNQHYTQFLFNSLIYGLPYVCIIIIYILLSHNLFLRTVFKTLSTI